MQKPKFSDNEIYHIYNRGVEKRPVFMDDKDHFRFIHDLYEMNDINPVTNSLFYLNKSSILAPTIEVELRYSKQEGLETSRNKPRELLVEVLAFTLMPNHFHLLVRQKRENGIVKFMQKLGTGYTNYFNKKHERVGGLFQGRFKAVLVKNDAHFIHIPFYIHTNPLDLHHRSSTSIVGSVDSIEFLENYRWSSFMDYIGKKNFPSVTSREFLLDFFGGEEEYKKATYQWIKDKEKNLWQVHDVALDLDI